VRRVQVQGWPDWHDPRRINVIVRHVVVALDVVEIHRVCNAVMLVKIAQVRPEIRIIDNPAKIAFEVAVINGVEPNQRREQAPVRLGHPIGE
jgi:hypothetical protein